MSLGIDQPLLPTAEKEAKAAQAKTQDQHLLVSNILNHRTKTGDLSVLGLPLLGLELGVFSEWIACQGART